MKEIPVLRERLVDAVCEFPVRLRVLSGIISELFAFVDPLVNDPLSEHIKVLDGFYVNIHETENH